MSEPVPPPPATDKDGPKLWPLVVVIAFAAAAAGGLIGRGLAPSSSGTATQSAVPGRPIVQIVRTPNFPSLAETIDRTCPSVARVAAADGKLSAPAFAVSADGWLVSTAPASSSTQLQAIFGDGRKAAITEVRSDPVSGLVIVHADVTGIPVLTFADQVFARVGDFGFSLESPNGSGCSAQVTMIGSDFLVDALAKGIYLRLQPQSSPPPPGAPYLGADGLVLGISTGAQDNSILPAPIAALIVNELIRNNMSPVASFGFRAIDFTPELGARIGGSRRGAGVALVEQGSSAFKAGLQAGDTIVSVDGSPVASESELSRALDAVTGSTTTLQIDRGTQQLSITLARST
ncbi:MAG TPA: PDZ domain-containing protein [Sphingomicrobium sp.]|nr:PDZ domain-containing protein [Sphingomicrobium sp.]